MYSEWKISYESVCEVNHVGSVRKMEKHGTIKMFSRANEKHDITYINYVGGEMTIENLQSYC